MSEKFFLKWNDFHSNISQSFSMLRKEDYLYDVTLTGDDHKHVRAHKLVLSAASEYFSNIFRQNSDNSNIIICFDGVNVVDIENALNYMYNGEIQIYQDDLDRFLSVAQKLKLKGLLGGDSDYVDEKRNIPNDSTEVDNMSIKEMEYTEKLKMKVKANIPWQPRNVTNSISTIENCNISNVGEQVNSMLEKTVDGKFMCKVCGKISNIVTNMRNHIEIHIEGLLFSCQECEKTFKSKRALNHHKVTFHDQFL